MRPDSHDRIDELFHAVLEYPVRDRTGRLAHLTAGNDGLRRELKSLLAAHASADGFLGEPVFGVLSDADLSSATSRSGDAAALIGAQLGEYRIEELIGEGGMGVVYRAVRTVDYQQEVAVKLVHRGLLSDALRRRFHAERQTLARLRHDSISRLIDGGSTPDGSPYLVMEYIDGRPIDVSCDDRVLGVRDRIALFCEVCDAVHYAHQNLVVHRDLKPTNILIAVDGRPKLLDFGIAKLIQDEPRIACGDATTGVFRLLTPRYAAPEQMRGDPVTTAADVYSLGVILYELLSGRRPFDLDCAGLAAANGGRGANSPVSPSAAFSRPDRASARLNDPGGTPAARVAAARSATPHALRKALRGDLDNIVLKAMEVETHRRYGSAQELANELRKYLAGLPVAARNGSGAYRAAKFVRRHKATVALSAALALALVTGAVGTSFGLIEARRDRRLAERQRNTAVAAQREAESVAAFLKETMTSANPYQTGRDAGTILDLLADAGDRIDTAYAGQPAAEAAVRYAIAETYAGLWRWKDVERHAARALQVNRDLHGDKHPTVADCLILLGRARTFAVDARAVDLQAEALAIRRGLFREDSPEVAWSKAVLAFALWHAASPPRFEEAELLYLDAVSVYRRKSASYPMKLGMCLHSLGAMYGTAGRHAEAARALDQALAVYRSMPVQRNRYLAECVRSRSNAVASLGRHDEAMALLREYIELTPPGFRSDTQACDAVTRMTYFLERRAECAGSPHDAAFFRNAATGYQELFAADCNDDTASTALATASR
ncbi:MAG: serine/threonine protein kinase [Phycisphaerales bacterium]|nr:serine/threonine protein kinase [Phycisphaerales bacterium]